MKKQEKTPVFQKKVKDVKTPNGHFSAAIRGKRNRSKVQFICCYQYICASGQGIDPCRLEGAPWLN